MKTSINMCSFSIVAICFGASIISRSVGCLSQFAWIWQWAELKTTKRKKKKKTLTTTNTAKPSSIHWSQQQSSCNIKIKWRIGKAKKKSTKNWEHTEKMKRREKKLAQALTIPQYILIFAWSRRVCECTVFRSVDMTNNENQNYVRRMDNEWMWNNAKTKRKKKMQDRDKSEQCHYYWQENLSYSLTRLF